jgi:hypothetical protein
MLAELQRDFRQWLTRADDEALRRGLVSTRGLSAYQNNYRAQLVRVLQASYPRLLAWLGDEAFLEAAVHHVERRPPSSWTLDAYGTDFAETLRAMYPAHPNLTELAWIEWTLSEVFVAADAPRLDPAALAGVDWDKARLRLSPGLRLRPMTTNAIDVWFAWQEGMAAPGAAMLDAPAGAAVWRQGFAPRLRAIDATEHAALLSLREDARFSALCDALVAHLGEDEGVARAGGLLADWVGGGDVVAVDAGG